MERRTHAPPPRGRRTAPPPPPTPIAHPSHPRRRTFGQGAHGRAAWPARGRAIPPRPRGCRAATAVACAARRTVPRWSQDRVRPPIGHPGTCRGKRDVLPWCEERPCRPTSAGCRWQRSSWCTRPRGRRRARRYGGIGRDERCDPEQCRGNHVRIGVEGCHEGWTTGRGPGGADAAVATRGWLEGDLVLRPVPVPALVLAPFPAPVLMSGIRALGVVSSQRVIGRRRDSGTACGACAGEGQGLRAVRRQRRSHQ